MTCAILAAPVTTQQQLKAFVLVLEVQSAPDVDAWERAPQVLQSCHYQCSDAAAAWLQELQTGRHWAQRPSERTMLWMAGQG